MPEDLSIKEAIGLQAFPEAKAIRSRVFIEEQGVVNEFDDADAVALQFLMLLDGKPIATARLWEKEAGLLKMGRLAVLAEYRGQGYGKILLEYVDRRAQERKARRLYFHAQTHALNFYLHLGYTLQGEPFQEEGIEHVYMYKDFVQND